MTEQLVPPPQDVENRAKFFQRTELFSEIDQLKTRISYDQAKVSHQHQERDSGERHFEHARAVALILYDECGLQTPDFFIGGVLHDTGEDNTLWGSMQGMTYSQWVSEARARMNLVYFPLDVADPVLEVTKPKVDGIEIKDESEVLPAYVEQLRKAGPRGKVIKLADILHNSRTLGYRKPHKQIEVAGKNLYQYLPVLREGRGEYEEATNWMIAEIIEINKAYLAGKSRQLRPDQYLAGKSQIISGIETATASQGVVEKPLSFEPAEESESVKKVFMRIPGSKECRWVPIDEMSDELYASLKEMGIPLADRQKAVPEIEDSGEQEDNYSVLAGRIMGELIKGRLSPVKAAASIKKIFDRQGLDPEEAYSRIISQHQFFSDSSEPLPQVQGVRWDNFVICIGESLGIPKEQRIRERLVPVGTPSTRPDLEDLAF